MKQDNQPMQTDPALFETMSRLNCSMPFTGHELGVLHTILTTSIESCEQIAAMPEFAAMPEQARATNTTIREGSQSMLARVNEMIAMLGIAASAIHAERMDAERNAPTSHNPQ